MPFLKQPCSALCWHGQDPPHSSLPVSSPQHFALLLKYLIQVAIPDIPAWVAEEMAKLEYQRREAFKVSPAPRGRASAAHTPQLPACGGASA